MDELCAQNCDDDIRKAIGSLPKTLAETFSRALLRVTSRRKVSVAVKTFSWVATAKRPLTLGELREAISIEIGQPFLIPERLINGIDQLASWCENLVHVDEELKTVQFAHQAIHKFIIEGPTAPQLRGFRFDLADADHHAGEICVTYLSLNDFKTTLARRPQPMKPVDPAAIATVALSPKLKLLSTIPGFSLSSRRHNSKAELDVVGVLSSYGRENAEKAKGSLKQAYPFLEYASTHWISHTSRFGKGSTTWNLLHQIVTCGHDLAKIPWLEHQESHLVSNRLSWGLEARHFGLVRLLQSRGSMSEQEKYYGMRTSAAQGDIEMIDVFLEGDNSLHMTSAALIGASRAGNLMIVERLLEAGVKVNTGPNNFGRLTALQAASEGGHLEVVERLIIAGADINADPAEDSGYTALQAASSGGHLGVVERLLNAGANANASPAEYYGHTALQAASEGGHLGIVDRLLKAGADANAGYTAPKPLGAVKRFILPQAIPYDAPRTVHCRQSALELASENGHVEVVERLLLAGANVSGDRNQGHGDRETALELAFKGGHLEVVKRL